MSNAITYNEIEKAVHRFYSQLRQHPKLSVFFSQIEDFESHEKRISDFWWISMGGKLGYPLKIDMMAKHLPLGIDADDLETWLSLFSEILHEQLEKDKAEKWMAKVQVIATRLRQVVIEKKTMGLEIKMQT